MSTTSPRINEHSDFATLVTRLGYLPPDEAAACVAQSIARGAEATQVALQRGVLTAVQYEIVETLLRPEEAIPGYFMVDLLGHGGMGAVFRARQKNLNRLVALKTVLVSQMSGTGAIARFEQEATTIARLVHPHIVAAYDFGRHQGRLYLAMELVEGENAEDLLVRRGHLEEALVWQIIRQAASGLAHAASLGIVHRDIKPANLMLVKPPAGYPLPTGVPLVKIADFGLAFLTNEPNERTRLTSADSALGSPHYMAPEQLTNAPVDLRTDMYALGATAYHLLSGRPPFHGMAIAAIVGQKLSSGPEPLSRLAPQLSPASVTLTDRLMRLRPEDRPGDYESVIAECDALLAELSTIASAATTRIAVGSSVATAETQAVATAPDLPKRRLLARWGGAGAIGLVLILALVGVWRARGGTPTNTRPLLAKSGQIEHLFTGNSLAGWRNVSGGWRDTTDDEGAPVIEGSNGVIAREIPSWAPGQPGSGYELTFTVDPHESSAVELHFDIPEPATSESPRQVVRLTKAGIQLGLRTGEKAAFQESGKTIPWPRGGEGLHDVTLEKQANYRVAVDGVPIGSPRPRAKVPAAQFRLAAEGGPARFADIAVESLIIPE